MWTRESTMSHMYLIPIIIEGENKKNEVQNHNNTFRDGICK